MLTLKWKFGKIEVWKLLASFLEWRGLRGHPSYLPSERPMRLGAHTLGVISENQTSAR